MKVMLDAKIDSLGKGKSRSFSLSLGKENLGVETENFPKTCQREKLGQKPRISQGRKNLYIIYIIYIFSVSLFEVKGESKLCES